MYMKQDDKQDGNITGNEFPEATMQESNLTF
jgi:hypothetical protein